MGVEDASNSPLQKNGLHHFEAVKYPISLSDSRFRGDTPTIQFMRTVVKATCTVDLFFWMMVSSSACSGGCYDWL